MSQRPQIAIFAPLPPQPTGIADYCRELLPHWNRHFEAVYVIAEDAPSPIDLPPGTTSIRYREFLTQPEVVALPRWYQVGNNRSYGFMRREMLSHPGLTTVHDFILSMGILAERLPNDDPESFAARMETEYGAEGAAWVRLVEQQVENFDDLFRLPLNGSVLDRSLGVIVHNREAERRIHYEKPGLPVRCIPHHAAHVTTCDDDRAAARRRLGLSPDKLLFLSLGFAFNAKQNDLALRALGRIRDRLPPFEFHQVGELYDRQGILAALAESGLRDCFHSSGYVPLEQMHDYITAGDIVINLRYPSGLETSGTLLRALAVGRPAVIFDYDSFSDYPKDVAVKLPLDTFNTVALEAALLKLALDPEYRRKIGTAASAYVRRRHAVEPIAAAQAAFVREVLEQPRSRAARKTQSIGSG